MDLWQAGISGEWSAGSGAQVNFDNRDWNYRFNTAICISRYYIWEVQG